jgi:hypothetical protein
MFGGPQTQTFATPGAVLGGPSSDEKHDGEVKDWAYFASQYFKKGQSRVCFVQAIGRTMQAALQFDRERSAEISRLRP